MKLAGLNFITALVMTITYAIAAALRLEFDPANFVSTLAKYEDLRKELGPLLSS